MGYTNHNNTRPVPAYGPTDAPILWIGEAPGWQEAQKGRPFVGATGQIVRQALKSAGIDDEKQVRYVNAVPYNINPFPTGRAGDKLLEKHQQVVQDELARDHWKCIVACGGVALQRLTTIRDITQWRGSVIRPIQDLPHVRDNINLNFNAHEVIPNPWRNLRDDHVVIPTLHPSGIMQRRDRLSMPLFQRDVRKVAAVVAGKLRGYDFNPIIHPDPCVVWDALKNAKVIAFDTEFNPETKELYWTGVTANGKDIFGWPNTPHYTDLTRMIFERTDVEFVAHNIIADARILRANGYTFPDADQWYDSMIGMYCLNPGQEVGLSPTSRFYLDDVLDRKWMDKRDPIYNAYDVQYCWYSRVEQLKDAKRRPVDITQQMRNRFKLIPVCAGMEDRGLLVDVHAQAELIEENEQIILTHEQQVKDYAKGPWDDRVHASTVELGALDEKWEIINSRFHGLCPEHPRYKPSKRIPKCEVCAALRESQYDKWLAEKNTIQKSRTKIKQRVNKLGEGFNFKSSEHKQWLFYDHATMNLPIQRSKDRERRITADINAIERLMKLKAVKGDPRKTEVFESIVEMSHASKALGTFLQLKDSKGRSIIGPDGAVHPTYKVHGTKTGRLASGEDKAGERDKRMITGNFNALNIPDKWRRMYHVPEGKIIMGVDWKNQEGRLMALFSQDQAYIQAFRDEDAGGADVHCHSGAIMYGCDPADAKSKHRVKFKGQDVTARQAGKVGNHAWSYSMEPVNTLVKNYNFPLDEAVRIDEALSSARPGVVAYKQQLVREVFGDWEVGERPGKGTVPVRYAYNKIPGSRLVSNPFGWHMYMWGVGEVKRNLATGEYYAVPSQAAEAVNFRAQSTGGGMWADCACTLDDLVVLLTGTYDSFYIVCDDDDMAIREHAQLIEEVCCKPWPQLQGWTFPIDIKVGWNLGERKVINGKVINERGLRDL